MTRRFGVSCFLPRVAVCAAFVLLATVTSVRAQDRMAPIPQEKMTEAQKKAFAEYKAIRGSRRLAHESNDEPTPGSEDRFTFLSCCRDVSPAPVAGSLLPWKKCLNAN